MTLGMGSAPHQRDAKEEQIETYRSEPYVYAQMIAGKDAPCFGEAKNSWLTGTAAWTFVSVVHGPGYWKKPTNTFWLAVEGDVRFIGYVKV